VIAAFHWHTQVNAVYLLVFASGFLTEHHFFWGGGDARYWFMCMKCITICPSTHPPKLFRTYQYLISYHISIKVHFKITHNMYKHLCSQAWHGIIFVHPITPTRAFYSIDISKSITILPLKNILKTNTYFYNVSSQAGNKRTNFSSTHWPSMRCCSPA
jgi:hypothetical protein